MYRLFQLSVLFMAFAGLGLAQVEKLPSSGKDPGKNQLPPRYDRTDQLPGESSSKSTQIDISPPENDAKDHPNSSDAMQDADVDGSGDVDVKEFRPWDPHRARKDIEVGDYYFTQKNYRAALSRYTEALEYKPNDALANLKMAQCLDKLKLSDDAVIHYQEYLKILPEGEFAAEARKALERLKKDEKEPSSAKVQSK